MAQMIDVGSVYRAIFRIDATPREILQPASRIAAGTMTLDDYFDSQIERASTSTIPAFVFAARFIGAAPSSDYLDTLSNFARAQYASYVTMGSAQPQLGPYEALGRAFADTDVFKASYGLAIVADGASFVLGTYRDVFGRSPTIDQYANLKGQLDYFEALYLSSGMTGGDAAIRARGAVFGQMIGYQQTVQSERDINVLDEQARVFLSVVAKGDVSAYGGSLETLPVQGRTIDQSDLATVSFPDSMGIGPGNGVNGTTIYGDHITASSMAFYFGTRGLAVIDGGASNDVIEVGSMIGGSRVLGGTGNDRISLSHVSAFSGGPTIDGGAGNDMIDIGRPLQGTPGAGAVGATIIGGQGNDTLTLYGPATSLSVSGIETIIASSSADSLTVAISSEAFPTTITLGAGKDKLTLAPELANLRIVDGQVASLATIADFVKGEDTLLLSGYGAPSVAPGGVAAAATLEAALALVAANTAVGQWTPFEYGQSTYVFKQNGDLSLATGDGLVKLAGTTGLVVGTAGTSDLVFG